ncbi:unnamed protein product [Meloidogyne enterolobii]|uniref:Uncharacterized protein n=1 Tax=Meloidogyne enterolobii TaxID=390850 RepID=A0ACB1ADK8_MELEN
MKDSAMTSAILRLIHEMPHLICDVSLLVYLFVFKVLFVFVEIFGIFHDRVRTHAPFESMNIPNTWCFLEIIKSCFRVGELFLCKNALFFVIFD